MKSRRNVILLAVVAAAVVVPACTGFAAARRVATATAPMWPSWSLFPTRYNNDVVKQFGVGAVADPAWPDADGQVWIEQAANLKGTVYVGVTIVGMVPNNTYHVYWNPDGIVPGDVSTTWYNANLGYVTTDENGEGSVLLPAPAAISGKGAHTIAIFLNGFNGIYWEQTLLISENLTYTVQ